MRYLTRQQFAKSDFLPFLALLALIVYAPLPLASNRPWALALLGVLTGSLLLLNIWRPPRCSNVLVWRAAKAPLILLGLWLTVLILQIVTFPDAWLQVLGPRLFFDSNSSGSTVASISIDPYSTRLYLAKAVILSVVFWLVLSLVDSRRRLEWMAKVIVFSGLLQALSGVIMMTSATNFQYFFVTMDAARAHGSFVSPNHFAGYLEMTLAMGIGLMIGKLNGSTAKNWRQRLHAWMNVLLSGTSMLRLALVIMVVGLVASRSRGGNLAFFSSLLVTGILTLLLTKFRAQNTQERQAVIRTRSMIIFILSLIVLDVIIIGGLVGVEQVVQRIENTNLKIHSEVLRAARAGYQQTSARQLAVQHPEQSLQDRSEAIIPSLHIVRDFPLFGTGGGTFYLAFPHYRPVDVQGYFDHPHNDFVEFASEDGLLGVFVLCALLAHSLWLSSRLLMQACNQFARGMAFASIMGIISLLIHGAVDFNLQITANAMLFLILLSMPYLCWRLVKIDH